MPRKEFETLDQPTRTRLIEQAKREGRHADAARFYCQNCGKETDAIMYIDLSGKRYGRCCDPKTE